MRVTPGASRAEEWAIVLAATGIAHRVEETATGWVLVVAAGDAPRASEVLAAYDEESRVQPAPPPASYGTTWIGAAVAAGLVAFFAVTGPPGTDAVWFERGSASAERIVAGEWWRTVTALTLHLDLAHVLANALACLVLVTAVGGWVGPGLGIWLVLAAGVGGNAVTALLHASSHVAVGASTATFGALGILTALQALAGRRRPSRHRQAWVVIGASLALLGLLGTGARSDLLAHLFGTVSGAALGAVVGLLGSRPIRRSLQWALAILAIGAVAAAWRLALAPPGHP